MVQKWFAGYMLLPVLISVQYLWQIYLCMDGLDYDPLPAYWEPKCVVIGFPHTTNMDTVRALTYMKLAGINATLMSINVPGLNLSAPCTRAIFRSNTVSVKARVALVHQ